MKFNSTLRITARWLLAATFIGAGANHFRSESFYTRIVPPSFPNPRLLVQISGIAEIVGGIGILIPPLRRIAGWGLIALLIAVFPANLYMAMQPARAGAMNFPKWALYLRLPLQALLVAWVWFAMKREPVEQDGSLDRRSAT
jgi:uncharacterized membrane protein